MDICFRQSKLCAQMRYLRFVGRIFRRLVYETAMDTTTGLAAQMAYQFLFTLAPGLLFLWHLLGLFGTDPAKLHHRNKISAYAGRRLAGVVRETWLRGTPLTDDEPRGRLLSRGVR